jgi:hypothetical protein
VEGREGVWDFDGDFLGLFPNVPNGKSMKSTLFWVPLRNGDDVSWENMGHIWTYGKYVVGVRVKTILPFFLVLFLMII